MCFSSRENPRFLRQEVPFAKILLLAHVSAGGRTAGVIHGISRN